MSMATTPSGTHAVYDDRGRALGIFRPPPTRGGDTARRQTEFRGEQAGDTLVGVAQRLEDEPEHDVSCDMLSSLAKLKSVSTGLA